MKLNRWLWVVVAAAAGGLMPAAALSVTCEAGGLRQAVGNETDAVSLIVSGEINAADFDFIAFEMTGVDNLDLSGAQVVAYEGEPTFYGSHVFLGECAARRCANECEGHNNTSSEHVG